ncbi:MAG: HAD-IIIA family hydrolase [Candidatus Omnitrophica bacterium]|nr:HAD-IIIA family hydrolase [Candidatus Omnitrophota bacterium]
MKKAVFLDRDGVINVFPGNGEYVTKVKDLHFIPRALEGIKILSDVGYQVFVVSNQAGVGKGVFSQDKLNRITNKLTKAVEKAGGQIRKVFYCTHKPDAGCTCRKPGPGSVFKALKMMDKSKASFNTDYFVGDTKMDIEAGYASGCQTIFVLSGRENRRYMRTWLVQPNHIVKDLYDAARLITSQNGFLNGTNGSKKAIKRK